MHILSLVWSNGLMSLGAALLLGGLAVLVVYYANRNPAKRHQCPCGARARLYIDNAEQPWVCSVHAWVTRWTWDNENQRYVPVPDARSAWWTR